jgi:hypothetical protein
MSDIERQIEQWRIGLAASELLGNSDVSELENHLREEMEQLKTSDLSDEEAFLIARRRLGDTEALAAEFAKVNSGRRFANRLLWMAIGVLSYFLMFQLSLLATRVSALLGYAVGLRNPYLALLAGASQVAAFAGIGAVAWRCFVSRSSCQAAIKKTSTVVRMGMIAACVIVALWWIESLSRIFLIRTMPRPNMMHVFMAQSWCSLGWSMLMPFLLVGLIVVLAMRNRLARQQMPETQ